MYDIFSVNTTKLSLDEGVHVIPGFNFASGVAEAMLELQEMDFQLFKECLTCDYKELEYRQKSFNEAAINALHEGVLNSLLRSTEKFINWLVKTVKSIWHTVVGFVVNMCKRIRFFFNGVKNYEPTAEDLKFKVRWIDKSDLTKRYEEFMKLEGVNDNIFDDDEDTQAKRAEMEGKWAHNQLSIKSEPVEVEIGSVNELKTPKAVFDTTLWIEDISRRANSHADHIIKQAQHVVDMFTKKVRAANATKDDDNALVVIYGKFIIEASNLFKQDITDELKACNQVMAHFQKCYAESKKKDNETKNESYVMTILDDDFIREMTNYDFDQAIENCYIGPTGAVVCDF